MDLSWEREREWERYTEKKERERVVECKVKTYKLSE